MLCMYLLSVIICIIVYQNITDLKFSPKNSPPPKGNNSC